MMQGTTSLEYNCLVARYAIWRIRASGTKKGNYYNIATGRRSDIYLINKSTLLRPIKEQDLVNKVWTFGFHKKCGISWPELFD